MRQASGVPHDKVIELHGTNRFVVCLDCGSRWPSPEIRDRFPALVDAAHTIGAVQTRSLGTLGGNLVTAVPSLDSGPTLIALEAVVTIVGPGAGKKETGFSLLVDLINLHKTRK